METLRFLLGGWERPKLRQLATSSASLREPPFPTATNAKAAMAIAWAEVSMRFVTVSSMGWSRGCATPWVFESTLPTSPLHTHQVQA